MTFKKRLTILIVVQAGLFLVEVLMPYDIIQRRLALALTNVVATLGVWLVARDIERKGGTMPLWAMLVAAAAVWLDALANFFLFYTYIWWWDRFTHAFGGFALSIVAFQFWRPRMENFALANWFGLFMGQTIGAWYEVSEYLGDMWFDTRRVMSVYDSPRDMWYNFLGGAAAFVIYKLLARRRVARPARKVL